MPFRAQLRYASFMSVVTRNIAAAAVAAVIGSGLG
jgi:hypothetical protein